jgi:hypothetical protein
VQREQSNESQLQGAVGTSRTNPQLGQSVARTYRQLSTRHLDASIKSTFSETRFSTLFEESKGH